MLLLSGSALVLFCAGPVLSCLHGRGLLLVNQAPRSPICVSQGGGQKRGEASPSRNLPSTGGFSMIAGACVRALSVGGSVCVSFFSSFPCFRLQHSALGFPLFSQSEIIVAELICTSRREVAQLEQKTLTKPKRKKTGSLIITTTVYCFFRH